MLSVVSGVLAMLAMASGTVVVYTQDTPHLIAEEYRDMPASFGPELPLDGLRGLLVTGEPEDGCGNMTAPPATDNFTDKWIVLVARFNCNFETKVRNAMAAGYDCVIVHNVNSTDLETMSAKNPEGINIPSVFVSDIAGLYLAEKYTYTHGYYIMVNGDMPFNINTHLLLPFAVVVVLCLLIILIFMIVKCIKDRRRARRHRLPNRSLKKIPTCKFSKGDPYDTCAICLDDYQEGERLRVLPCAHAYHAKCVDPWLTENRRVCPVCKRRVLAAGERDARPRDSDDSDDTEPLLAPRTPPTQGGTFEPQRENPFGRAARLMSRLRRHNRTHTEEAPQEADSEHNEENGDVVSAESSPLIPPVSVRAVGERRPRARRERRRRARSADHAPAAAPAPAPAPDTHSINGSGRGEIGVAALPAPQSVGASHVDL